MKPGQGKKVVVAMSGGVDSSVAAAILKNEGYSVVGCFMRLGSEHEDTQTAAGADQATSTACANPRSRPSKQGCCSVDDAADARLVAAVLDVPFYVLNFRKDFDRIMDYFVAEYNAGRTPNPCVRCNDWLKFGKLAEYARSIDADYIASGHYARVDHSGNGSSASPRKSDSRSRLLRGIDHRKDQSYVLFGIKRGDLAHMLLPIGGMEKKDVRALAEELKLPVFNKPDSQEICFVPDNDYAAFVTRRSPEQVQPGKVLDRQGRVIGEHPGQQHFTVGQRRGLGVTASLPLYVLSRDAGQNSITVGGKDDLLTTSLEADQTNWLMDPPSEPLRCQVKVRYNGAALAGTVCATGRDSLRVEFDEPASAVTPGQAVVCYVGDELIGGGWIK